MLSLLKKAEEALFPCMKNLESLSNINRDACAEAKDLMQDFKKKINREPADVRTPAKV